MICRKNSFPFADAEDMTCDGSDDDEIFSKSPIRQLSPPLSASLTNKNPDTLNPTILTIPKIEIIGSSSTESITDSVQIPILHDNNRPKFCRRNSISLPSELYKYDCAAIATVVQKIPSNDQMTITDNESLVCSVSDADNVSHSMLSEDTESDDEKHFHFSNHRQQQHSHHNHHHLQYQQRQNHRHYFRTPLRTKRKLSVAPLPSLRLKGGVMLANDIDAQSVLSNQNSITSVNSLASLLKEKMQIFPSMIRKRKKVTSDFKIKAFVALLFLIIVFLVGYAYVMYHQKVLARMYFNSIKFDKLTRSIRIYDHAGREKISGNLGRNIFSEKPFNCLNRGGMMDGSICLEWDGIARMIMNIDEKEIVDCYSIHWQSLDTHINPMDCYDFSVDHGHWYGGGITKEKEWPLNRATFNFAPFVTGDASVQEFGNALKRYFISSSGVAIQVDDKTPLHISMNRNESKQFCLKAMNDDFAFVNRLTKTPELHYRICLSDDMRILHQQMTQQSLWDGLKETDIKIVHSILEEPVWQIPASGIDELSESTIYNYTENVIALGFLRLGHVLVNEFWQKKIGDFSLDIERFQTLEDTVNILHRRGFKIVFTVQPFISTDSDNFADAVEKKILIYERLSERSIPALTRYKSSASSGVLDITNNASVPWLLEKLNRIIKDYQIDSFFIDFGSAFNMPHYYQCNQSLANPDQYKTIFTSSLIESLSIVGVSGAIAVPKPPTFLSLPPVNASWMGLQSIIATVLSYGIIGYPFILPGPVGGDFSLPENNTKMLTYYSLDQPPLVDRQLYIRWLQLATFLPVMRFSHLPSEYKSEFVTEVAKELTIIRQKQVIPILKKYLSDAMNEGLPLVRPLWMLDAQDAACLYVNDEFSIGEELIVAPILYHGQTKREVYLPHGVWKDGIDGSLRKGSRWIHNYRVPEEKVAYFVKMPDNTRF